MAALSKTAFLSKWATLFADNSSRDISELDARDFRLDIADSFLNTVDRAYTGTVVVLANFDASTNTFPSVGVGSASDLSIKKGDAFPISVAGTLDGNAVVPGDLIIAKVDAATNNDADWILITASGGGGSVASVNGDTGTVVVDLQSAMNEGSSATFLTTDVVVQTDQSLNFSTTGTGEVVQLVNADGGSLSVTDKVTLGSELAMASHKVTGLAAASANGDAVRYEQLIQKANKLLPVNPQPGDYQLLATDADFTVGMDSASPQNLTIPLDATESIAVGSAFSILTVGAAPFTLVPESGAVTINVPSGATLDSAGQGTFIYLLKTGTNTWYATGTDDGGGGGSGTVTSVSFTGGIISVANPTTTPAFTVAGTSGGIPYFSSGTTWASSAALAANAIVVGGGAGAAPATVTTGTGVLTALGVNVGTDGAFVVKGGALGTPSDNTVWKVGGNTIGADAVLGISSGAFALNIQTNGVTHYSIAATGTHTFTQSIQAATNTFAAFTQAAHTSGVATGLVWTGGAHTGSTASTEHLDWDINNSATITKAAGAITLQRSILFRGRTFSAPSASLITNLVNIEVNPPAIAGSATATNIHSIRSTGGWITAQQTATSTQGFRLEQSANVATMSFQGSNIFRLTSVSTMTIGPTSTGVFNLTGARNINYTAAANTVVTAHTFASSDTVSTANTTFASFTCSYNTVPAGVNTLIKHIANFTESAAVASTYVNTLIDGTLVFGASPTGAYYGIRVNPTITSLNSITGHGIVVDSPLLHNGFGVSVPTAVLQARGANNTVAFLAEDDGGNAIASFGESGGNRVIGFFGATPVVQQTMGAATAGGTYTATEQAMIQAVYDAVRNIGIGT